MTHEQGLNYLGVTRSELRKVGSQPSFFLCTVQTKCGSGSRFRGYTSAGQAPTLVDATQIRGLQMVRLWTFMERRGACPYTSHYRWAKTALARWKFKLEMEMSEVLIVSGHSPVFTDGFLRSMATCQKEHVHSAVQPALRDYGVAD
eukprot:CAMPEP_0198370346 /NCGR_PEP_ID=MMETSP1450-20131203/156666_1 /TAXON_ID=753684 ORGANISM="Madagascaria erythrocladiodes, Strain CCMP3234" /NCGR_SAMPLE_ID=MMETSP1450 /ASSEMBLY_ACC=CAM_ASM_001115 /LENGTH=145 /DNA_ID=CAMNT_0044077883 /DNA_START=2414 /DNA_END=2852 /DNA_ORIENTATION=+